MGALLQSVVGPASYTVQVSAENGQSNLSEITVEANTTAGAVTINLPPISGLGIAKNVKIKVLDKGKNAFVNNITIVANVTAPDKINNAASIVINTNGGFFEIETGDENDWVAVN